MPKIYALIIVAALAMAAWPSQAQNSPMVPSGRVLGAGADPCSTWTSARSTKGGHWQEHAQWINGYLSSQSQLLYFEKKIDLLSVKKIDGYNMLPGIDTFCADNPNAVVMNAAQELFAKAFASLSEKSSPAP